MKQSSYCSKSEIINAENIQPVPFVPVSVLVSVLFARPDSCYKTFPNVDVWDQTRDARNWTGGNPVVAHPPCRAWSRLRHFARPLPGERALATLAIRQVRKYGGVLEHPVGSSLWVRAKLPAPGCFDSYGGWTLPVSQHWWGHRAEKKTLLYICGVSPFDIPDVPLVLGEPTHVCETRKRENRRPSISKSEREHTPIEFASWLVHLASLCRPLGKSSMAVSS